jgi:hypothetical protein
MLQLPHPVPSHKRYSSASHSHQRYHEARFASEINPTPDTAAGLVKAVTLLLSVDAQLSFQARRGRGRIAIAEPLHLLQRVASGRA